MVPRGRDDRPSPVLFGAAGWLFADLLLALAMIFLVANSVGQVTIPKPTPAVVTSPTPTPTPSICGIEQNPGASLTLTVSNDAGLRANDGGAEMAFADQVRGAMQKFSGRTAGLVQVYGGSYNGSLDVQDGMTLANGAINGLKHLGSSRFIFSSQATLFQPFWSGTINSNQVQLVTFFFKTSSGVGGCTT